MPIYFLQDDHLIPEYRTLDPDNDPAVSVMLELQAGPTRPDLGTALPARSILVQAGESEEGFVIELNENFWSVPVEDRSTAASQIVHSLSALEPADAVTLLDALVPGELRANGENLSQPVVPGDLDREPLFRITQPVAGSLVADPMPVDVDMSVAGDFRVELVAGGSVIGEGMDEVDWEGAGGAATVRITSEVEGETYFVELPVRLPLS